MWERYTRLFGASTWAAVLAAIPMLVALAAIVVRGFQHDTWAWTEYYADGFYYLAYAKSAAQGEFFSYGGVGPSSGFHPLHWLYLAAVHGLTGGNHSWFFPILFAVYALGFAVTTWAVILTLRALGVGVRILVFSVLAMTYGNYLANALDIPSLVPVIFTNFINMMPSWLLITSMTLLIAAGVRHLRGNSPAGWTLIVIATVVTVWARIDYIFVILPFVLIVAWRSETLVRWQRFVVALAAPAAFAAWSILLWIVTGIPVPTSGAVKNTLSHALDIGSGISFLIDNAQASVTSAHAQMAIAGTLGTCVLLAIAWRSGLSRRDPVVQAFAVMLAGMLVLFGYHMFFTFTGDAGGWYFRPYRVLMLIIGMFALSSIPMVRSLARGTMATRAMVAIVVVSVVWISASHLNGPAAADDSLARAHLVRDVVGQLEKSVDPDATFYDGTDGAFAWYGDFTAYHVKGMANIPDYVDIGRNVRILDLDEMIPVYRSYLDETNIDYYVSYGKGDTRVLTSRCWQDFDTIAYAQKTLGNRMVNAFAVRSDDWLMYLECLVDDSG